MRGLIFVASLRGLMECSSERLWAQPNSIKAA